MRSPSIILTTAIASAIVTAILHDSASVLIYKLTEPHFAYPIKFSRSLPIRNDDFGDGTYGSKRNGGRSHTGIDITANVGTPVYAARSGLAFCGNVPTGYGKYILIYHPDGTQSMYGHLSNWAVNTGKRVRRGDLVGYVGKTGNAANKSIRSHLHFEIRKDGDPLDPTPLMR